MQGKPGLIDSHCHIFQTYYHEEIAAIIQSAAENNITHMLNVGCDLEGSKEAVELAAQYPSMFAAVGIHPHEASSVTTDTIDYLRQLAQSPKVVAIGETGLDYYRNRSPQADQIHAFNQHIDLARELNLPLIIHNRDANDDTLSILEKNPLSPAGGVMHCFSGDIELAKRCLDLGLHISLAGPVTYPKNEILRQVAAMIPDDRLLIETDAPYLSPQKFRGKRNEPALIRHTAQTISEVRGVSLDDIARIITRNSQNIFGFNSATQGGQELSASGGAETIGTPETIAYKIRNSLYLNITNRCTNSCSFCAKFNAPVVKGHELYLESEPSVETILNAVGEHGTDFDEVVFCGFGEPLLRPEVVIEVSKKLKSHGITIRINTDGQANLVHGENILKKLSGIVDSISISLNAPDAESYQKICQSEFGTDAYPAVIDFILEAKKTIPQVAISVVTVPGIDIEACKTVAEKLGVPLRIREYNVVG